jgi:hypothetical protein
MNQCSNESTLLHSLFLVHLFDILRKRQIMLPILVLFFQRIVDHLQMFFVTQEIGIAGVDKKRFDIVMYWV